MNTNKKILWVLRHGEAHQQAEQDHLRELTDYGREQVQTQADYLNEQKIQIDELWVSPYIRAQQTADELLKYWPTSALRKKTPLIVPEGDIKDLLAEINKSSAKNIMLVSHQPLVNRFVAYLVHGQAQGRLVESMYTAALAKLNAEEWLPGCANLEFIRQAEV